METMFWWSYILLVYVYLGYPLILTLLTTFHWDRDRKEEYYPQVSFIIAAYNEEKVITKKINDTLDLHYPKDKFEIIVASDASSDMTDDIVQSFEDKGVRLVRSQERRGKTAAQNLAVKEAHGEILIFSDATTIYDKEAVTYLARRFVKGKVGAVAGVEKFIDSKTKIAQEASFFWNYELYIRERESKLNTMISVSGCIFAIRKNLYGQLPEGLIEDFALPLKVAERGFKVIQEKRAFAYEEAVEETHDEFTRKARIVAGGIAVLVHMKQVLNPLKHPLLSIQVISHKVLRWLAPVLLLFLFIILFFVPSMYFQSLIGSQTAFFSPAKYCHIPTNALPLITQK